MTNITLGFSPNPSSNTGFVSQTVTTDTKTYALGVDWLTVICRFATLEELHTKIDCLASYLSDSVAWGFENKGRQIGRWWDSTARSANGMVVAYNQTQLFFEALISISGSVLSVPELEIARGLCHLRSSIVSVSRFDVCLDDYTLELSELRLKMYAAFKDGNSTGFSKVRRFSDEDRYKKDETLYLGSRSSTHLHRIYDKDDRVRMEVELHDDKAFQAFNLYMDVWDADKSESFSNGMMHNAFTSIIFSHIDFIQKDDKNLARNERLDWWQSFMDKVSVTRVKFSCPKRESSIERTKRWLEKQVETSLAMVRKAMGAVAFQHYFDTLMQDGAARLGSLHLAIIDSYKLEKEMQYRYGVAS